MLNEMWGAYGSNLTVAVVGVAAGFFCLILVLWLIRGRGGPAPFLRGGKNRQPRLQVLDAAAVDARRRLVLVRRDDVEHLIMIGGPTDVVIESSIVDGRSPPYHTMMKTVSEPEQAAIAAAEEPRMPQQRARQADVTAPSARVTPPIVEKAQTPATGAQGTRLEDKADFAWLGSDAVELPPVAKPAESARAAAPQPAVRRPETPTPAESSALPAQSLATPVSTTPAAKNENITPPADTRSSAPAPVVDFPTIEPRAMSAATVSAVPVATAFSQSAAAVAVAPVVVASVAMKAEPAPTVRIDDTPSETSEETPRNAAKDVVFDLDHGFDITPPRAENDSPSLDHAVDLLDAARERVFQQPRSEAVTPASSPAAAAPIAPPAQRPSPAMMPMPAAPAPAPAKPLGSDFERILEEEMASNLAGGNSAPAIGPAGGPAAGPATANLPPTQMPRRDPALPRVTGASQEPAMQNEIARIFGEMSVTKDDR